MGPSYKMCPLSETQMSKPLYHCIRSWGELGRGGEGRGQKGSAGGSEKEGDREGEREGVREGDREGEREGLREGDREGERRGSRG